MEARTQAVRRVLVITLVLNLAVAAAKIGAGVAWHLLGLTADGAHSSLDGLNNVVGLVALWAAAQPPDARHPYGHRKFETFAALGIGLSLGIMGVSLAREAIGRFRTGGTPEGHPAAFAVALGTLLVEGDGEVDEQRRGRALGSELLLADAQHTRGDLLVTGTVIVSLVAVRLGAPLVDMLAALGIAAFIGFTAWRIVVRNLQVLADAVAVNPAEVEALARAEPGVHGCHKVRSRSAAGHVFVDLHVQVDPALPIAEAHALGHRVADSIKRSLGAAEVLVHVEPFSDPG
jgi:cation diffusion facilitator family transporter